MITDPTPIYTETLIDSAMWDQVPYEPTPAEVAETARQAAWLAEMTEKYGPIE